MEWSEPNQKWLMKLPTGAFLFDFWDCVNINRLFGGRLDKHKATVFELDINYKGDENGSN